MVCGINQLTDLWLSIYIKSKKLQYLADESERQRNPDKALYYRLSAMRLVYCNCIPEVSGQDVGW